MPYWHAFVERNGQPEARSELDAIEADSPDSAARRAIRHYWIRQRHLFDQAGRGTCEIVVVVSEYLLSGPRGDDTTATRGTPTRWTGKVVVGEEHSGLEIQPGYDRTQTAWVSVERLV